MFAFLGSAIGKYLFIGIAVLLVFGIAGLYIKYTTDTIASLNQQVTALQIQAQSLQAANDSLKRDINNVQQAQDAANRTLENIRVQSAQNARIIQNRVLNTTDPKALQDQVNSDTATTFKALEDLSRAK